MSRQVRRVLGVVLLACLLAWAVWALALAPLSGLLLSTTVGACAGYLVGRRTGRKDARQAAVSARGSAVEIGQAGRAGPGAAKGAITDQFHRLYYDSMAFADTYWLGITTLKCPLDMWAYQEIIHEVKPDVIVECGTAHGGSALFLACVCDLVGRGEVLTVDVEAKADRPSHPRVRYILGSSTAAEVVAQVRDATRGREVVMVILDSDHSRDHVLAELRLYGELVTPGSYMIVEDTNLGHAVRPDFGPGPMEAVTEFLGERDDFIAEKAREKFLLTFNPGGYLRKVR